MDDYIKMLLAMGLGAGLVILIHVVVMAASGTSP
jgi:hypothetical protein